LGGVINYPVTVFPAGYDPHRKPSFGPFVTIPVFNNLVRYDPTAKNNSPSTIVGDLAEKWTVSPDGLTWEFNLRQGVKWHDGKPFTADDVIFTFEKLKDPARSALSDYWKIVTSASKTNDYTVRLTLSTQSPSMLLQLTNCYAAVLPKHITADWPLQDETGGRRHQYRIAEKP
jgi:peptide/nickel transport system substrate-binding protein